MGDKRPDETSRNKAGTSPRGEQAIPPALQSAAVPAGGIVAPQLEIAEQIARRAHDGQKEESTGDDYIHHVERVVALVEGDDAKAVAWLHDVLEDSPWTERQLIEAGISERIIEAVVLLTRTVPYQYPLYIEQIQRSGNALAIAVKLADLRDHLRPNCPERLRPRYEKALAALADRPARPQLLEEQEDHSRVAPLKAGADGQDLPQSGNKLKVTAAERTENSRLQQLVDRWRHEISTADVFHDVDGKRYIAVRETFFDELDQVLAEPPQEQK